MKKKRRAQGRKLADLRKRASVQYKLGKRAFAGGVEHMIRCGAYLLEAKARPELPHGKWLPWLAGSGIPERSAQRCMQLAKNRTKIEAAIAGKSVTLTDLSLGAALDLLMPPREPAAAAVHMSPASDDLHRRTYSYRQPGAVSDGPTAAAKADAPTERQQSLEQAATSGSPTEQSPPSTPSATEPPAEPPRKPPLDLHRLGIDHWNKEFFQHAAKVAQYDVEEAREKAEQVAAEQFAAANKAVCEALAVLNAYQHGLRKSRVRPVENDDAEGGQ